MDSTRPVSIEVMFEGAGRVELCEHRWPGPQEGTRAVLGIIHGYGHHAACFGELAAYLTEAGYDVRGFDLRGHGKSEGRRGHMDSFALTLDDVHAFVQRIQSDEPDKSFFLLGHSLGALIVGQYAVAHRPKVRGLIFSSGLLKIPDSVPPWLVKLGTVLSRVLPLLPVQKVDFDAVSREPEAVRAVYEDRLRYTGLMNARTGAEIARAVHEFQTSMDRITDPLLILHGTGDRLTDTDGSRQFFARATAEDKTLSIYKGGYHELYNDLEKERYLKEVRTWLDARSRQARGTGGAANGDCT